ncbi:hypothetical protein FJZ33_00430 [Candidatus Poribacteria bacterium]|nr:hypothetical protein [Candidatus Poribacteria bacterium]
MIDIEDMLDKLSKKRPVFHSEADFQHALAWEIHKSYPGADIRLEKRIVLNGDEIYIDISISLDNDTMLIELKYKTKGVSITIFGEEFKLKDQSAQDCNRYDFIKDISRIEKCLRYAQSTHGAAILLTNDPNYWNPDGQETADRDFRIYDGKTLIKRKLEWKEGTSEGTSKGREEPICLENNYNFHWKDYSDMAKHKDCHNRKQNGLFRYLYVKVK